MRIIWILLCLLPFMLTAQKEKEKEKEKEKKETPKKPTVMQAGTYGALSFRSIGPAVTSGRISDFAVNPANPAEYYVASASGGVWKTVNAGTTYSPIFDGQGSYSIGCVTLDPTNPNVVWVGSGENNSQRSVAYGDGVYKSEDGGKSFKNKGLKNSEHIANVVVDPTNPNTVYVAAYGPVWSNGGDRGVYKSTDGGETWTCVKSVSIYTGCNNLIMDPRDSKVLYAAFHQRQRKVYTYIGGGPESAVYKTTDGGATWKKIEGLPGGEVGRIGIDISPVNPDYVYAVVEAGEGKGGVFRSTDRGSTWQKMSGTSTSGNYYQELTCDPVNVNRIFITDTYYKVSDDGGKTMRNLGEINKHIDNHAIWIDPRNTNHLLVGCDGGVYETWDFAKTWDYKANLPVTQFYKVSTDNALPFYNVHGGTQDNLSLGGPSRNNSINGIPNDQWIVTSVGDGFETQVDPTNPDIIYAQSQYGGLLRFDRKSGEYLTIKAIEGENEPALRWNWDAPLLISNFSPTRLYHGANIVFRTDDRGETWRAISPDLSRGIDRNKLEVMDKVWSMDALAKNASTDIYGQTTTIAESPKDEKVLWVGTDDGLLHRTTDGGASWTKMDNLPGVPERSYVHQVIASNFDKNTAYVCYNHHRYGDFKPYLLKTTDGGKSWKSIADSLPQRGSVYTIAEDHVDPNLLFCGTEFGVFFSHDGGANWLQLQSGLPTIAVRDIEIQRRENDLVLGTFGRGFYILDDYSPLRNLTVATFEQEAAIFPIKEALMFVPSRPLGLRDKGHLGSSYYAGENPPVGSVFTYWLKEDVKTLKDLRKEAEKAMAERKETVYYPEFEQLYKEDAQPEPYLLFTITNAEGDVVRHIKAPAKKGLNRIVWDFRYAPDSPSESRYSPAPDQLFGEADKGYMAKPGTYRVSLSKVVDGVVTTLVNPVSFQTKLLNNVTLPTKDWSAREAFSKKVSDLRKAITATQYIHSDLEGRLSAIKANITEMPAPPEGIPAAMLKIEQEMKVFNREFNGDNIRARREFENKTTLSGRLSLAEDGLSNTTAPPTGAQLENYEIAARQFPPFLEKLKKFDQELEKIEKLMEMKEAPYTPGRWPMWKAE